MDYRKINTAVLNGERIDVLESEKENIYKYLIQNDCGTYFATEIISNPSQFEKRIIESGDKINAKFSETLREINQLHKENRISYVLFKTYKYIPDVYAGDIDILVSLKDIEKVIAAYKENGYTCIRDGKDKWECTKPGRSKIEPRTAVSHHGIHIADWDVLLRYTEQTNIFGTEITKTTRELDVLVLLLNCMYGPNSLRLQLYKTVICANWNTIKEIASLFRVDKEIETLHSEFFSNPESDKRFPLFLSNRTYVKFWLRKVFASSDVSLLEKVKHLLFFFYMKYKYILFNNMVFKRQWLLE